MTWFRAAGIRAARAVGVALVPLIPVKGALMGTIDWRVIALTAIGAVLTSLAFSLASLPELGSAPEPLDDVDAHHDAEVSAATACSTPEFHATHTYCPSCEWVWQEPAGKVDWA